MDAKSIKYPSEEEAVEKAFQTGAIVPYSWGENVFVI